MIAKRKSWAVVLLCIIAPAAAAPAGQPAKGQWVAISDGVLAKLEAEKAKIGYPGKATGVAVDRTTGDVYMVICGQGIWKSTDKGKTFQRVDGGLVGGRCETGYSLAMDPAGGRLACFMLDGKSAITADGCKTWTPMKNVQRGFDWASPDWSSKPLATVLGLVHESGGIGVVSSDGGKTWNQIGKDYLAVGAFGPDALLCSRAKEKAIHRSSDGGATWTKVSDAAPIGAMSVFKGVGYWLSDQGLLTSKDQGKTWRRVGEMTGAAWGPYFGADEMNFVVVTARGFEETTDAGKTYRLIAPLPPELTKSFNNRGWFLNVAWDPIGKVCYAAKMGQPAWKCEYQGRTDASGSSRWPAAMASRRVASSCGSPR